MSQYRFFNTIPLSSNDNKLAGWYKIDNKNNAALRVYDCNVLLPGIIRFNETTNMFQGYNGINWVSFNALKGDKGDKGDNFNKVVQFSNMGIDLNNIMKNVEKGDIFKTHDINFDNNNTIYARTLLGGNFNLNSKQYKSINIKQNDNNILLESLPQPFIWDLSNIKSTENNNNITNDDNSLKCYGNIAIFKVDNNSIIKKGQFLMSEVNSDGELIVKPLKYTASKSKIPNFSQEPINVIGVALEDINNTNTNTNKNNQTCKVCTSGITYVLTSSDGGYLSADMNVKKEGMYGIINNEGRIIKTNRIPINNYLIGGTFMEKKILKDNDYILFNVNNSICFE